MLYMKKYLKSHTKIIISKYLSQREMKILNYLMDHILQLASIQYYFAYTVKKDETLTDNLAIRIYVNKIKNKVRVQSRTFNA